MVDYGKEEILVLPREKALHRGVWLGINPEAVIGLFEKIESDPLYLSRNEVEENLNYKQVIPYTVIHCQGQFLFYRRTHPSGDPRIKGIFSVGIGGHLSQEYLEKGIVSATERKVRQELDYEGPFEPQLIGILNSERNAVSAAHIGIVFLLDVDKPPKFKDEHHQPEMLTIEELRQRYAELEDWSQIVLDYLKSQK